MAEFEPIPEEIPRQSLSSVSRSHKEGGSADRLSKSSEKHGVKEKKRSSKNKSKGDSPSSGHDRGHRSGSNSSSKSGSNKHKSEPLISLTSTVDMDMGLSGSDNHGTVASFKKNNFYLSIHSNYVDV